jgi:hypothetical protein
MPDGSGTQKLICALDLNKGNATDNKTADSPTDGREDSKIKHSLQPDFSNQLEH